MDTLLFSYLNNLTFIGLFFVIIVLAKLVYNWTTPYCTFAAIKQSRNLAIATSITGYLIAVSIIYVAALVGPTSGLLVDLKNVSLYSLLGIGLLLISRIVNDKVLLHSFCNHTQLVEKNNLSVGLAQASSYITSGLIIAGALTGEGSIVSALVFYSLAQICLVVFARFYDLLTDFKLLDELAKGNKAAALSFSGTTIAIGIILLHALTGAFTTWQNSLMLFAIDAVIAFLVLPFVRLLIDKVLMSSIHLDSEIKSQNKAVALFEAGVAVSVSLVIFFAL